MSLWNVYLAGPTKPYWAGTLRAMDVLHALNLATCLYGDSLISVTEAGWRY